MAAEKPEPRRCAIYTRKSSEEGLEQDFNSLDAQREACEAYILSQVGEGWKLIKDRYDDGGFSGGNVKRPGLQQLLTDVAAGKVDIIVVYKVDRLTRSLPDFAKIVEVFDEKSVSFVSVTQQFNTTTSMGRLTLNMLLSFAQFEREVTGERIRDKIAASKKKGLWMGGLVPLGYEADGRTLKIVPKEAATVRTIFTLYRDLRSSWKVKQEADRLGLRTKLRTFKGGRTSGGMLFRYGHIHRIVHNPLYIGKIQHKGVVHEGQQDAIIDTELWEATRIGRSTESERRGRKPRRRKKKPIPYPLRGKLFDEMGMALSTDASTKGNRRYRYYLSARGSSGDPETDTPGNRRYRYYLSARGSSGDPKTEAPGTRPTWRLAAPEIEGLIERGIRRLLSEPRRLAHAAIKSGIAETDVPRLIEHSAQASKRSMALLERAELHTGHVTVWLAPSSIADGVVGCIRHDVQMDIRRSGVETRLVLAGDGGRPATVAADPALLKTLARASAWFTELAEGRVHSIEELGRQEGVSDRYIGAIMPLAFVSPMLIRNVLKGKTAQELTADALIKRTDIPLAWVEQELLLGFD